MGLSPRKGQQTWLLGGCSITEVTKLGLSPLAHGHNEQSCQHGCGGLHGAVAAERTTSVAGAGLSSARYLVPAAAALLLSPGFWVGSEFLGGLKERR